MASRTINIPATTDLDADELTSGTVPFARLSTGTGSTQVAARDHTHTAAAGCLRLNSSRSEFSPMTLARLVVCPTLSVDDRSRWYSWVAAHYGLA